MSKCCLSFSIALSDGVRSPSLSIAQFARPLLPTFVCSYRCPRNRTVPPWWALHFSFVCWFCHLATQSFFFHLCFICAQLLGLCGCPREGWPDGRSGLLMSIEYRSSRHILSPATPRRSSLFSAFGWFRLPRRAELLHVLSLSVSVSVYTLRRAPPSTINISSAASACIAVFGRKLATPLSLCLFRTCLMYFHRRYHYAIVAVQAARCVDTVCAACLLIFLPACFSSAHGKRFDIPFPPLLLVSSVAVGAPQESFSRLARV